jgi:hypothetical protein
MQQEERHAEQTGHGPFQDLKVYHNDATAIPGERQQ